MMIKKHEESGNDLLKFVPLGGFEEVGRNMMFFEYRNEIVVIDVGFQFPEEETPGVDYIIPNVNYLEKKKENIKAIILTHGHYDHIGAITSLMEKLGNPVIYATELTKAIVERRQEEFPRAPKLKIVTVKNGDRVEISKYFSAEFFGVEHNIPETTGVVLNTPVGNIVHFADFKIGYDKKGEPELVDDFKRIGKQGVLALLLDSTNAEETGTSLPEETVEQEIEKIFTQHKDRRIIIAMFASLLTRVVPILRIAEEHGRKIAVSGRSMITNIQIARNLGYIKAKDDTFIQLEELHRYKDSQVLILTTGAQGEPNASLMRIANGEHKQIQIVDGDVIIFSASVVPGNERQVQNLRDNLARQGAKVYYSKIVDIHSSGHAPQEELKLVMKLIKPKFLIPIHGYFFMRYTNCEVGEQAGIHRNHCILSDNGSVIEITADSVKITDKIVDSYYVLVDGLGVGDVEQVVLRDRKVLAQEGMIVVIATLDKRTGHLVKNPDIISRGFIYLRESQEMLEEIRKRVRGIIARIPRYQPIDPDYLKAIIRDQVGELLYKKTKRRPMVLPVVIQA